MRRVVHMSGTKVEFRRIHQKQNTQTRIKNYGCDTCSQYVFGILFGYLCLQEE